MPEQRNARFVALSETQNRVVAASLTFLSAAALAVGFVALVWLVLEVLGYFLHIVGPVIVAFFLSLLTRPWYARLRRWCRHDVPTAVA